MDKGKSSRSIDHKGHNDYLFWGFRKIIKNNLKSGATRKRDEIVTQYYIKIRFIYDNK